MVAGWAPTMRGPRATGNRLETTCSTEQSSHFTSKNDRLFSCYFTRVGVHCDESNRSSPFVMLLVDVLIYPEHRQKYYCWIRESKKKRMKEVDVETWLFEKLPLLVEKKISFWKPNKPSVMKEPVWVVEDDFFNHQEQNQFCQDPLCLFD